MLAFMCLWTQLSTLKVLVGFECLIWNKKEISMSICDGPNKFILYLEVLSLPFPAHCISIRSDLDFSDPGYLADIAGYLSSVSNFARILISDWNMWHIERARASEFSHLQDTDKVNDTKDETKYFRIVCVHEKTESTQTNN